MQLSKVPIRKISENYYEFGTRKIYIKLDREEVMVRDKGGNYVEVRQYIRDNEDAEYDKLARGETRFSVS